MSRNHAYADPYDAGATGVSGSRVTGQAPGLLLESQCPVEIDRPKLTLTYSKQYESAVANAIRQLKTEYRLEIEDISS